MLRHDTLNVPDGHVPTTPLRLDHSALAYGTESLDQLLDGERAVEGDRSCLDTFLTLLDHSAGDFELAVINTRQ